MTAVPLQPVRLLAAAGAAAPLSGCGHGGRLAVIQRGPIALEQCHYRFKPQAVRGRAGAARIAVVNRGRLPHALQLRRRGRERLRIATVLPGRRGAAAATLPPGRYRLACPIGNDEELGMHGVLTLR